MKSKSSISTKYALILIFIFLAILASAVLSFIPIEKACGLTNSGCYRIQVSQYEKTFGVKNAYPGLMAFVILFIITFLQIKNPTKEKKQFLLGGLIASSIIALYFLYLQFFVIRALCKYCLVVDLGVLTSLGIMFFLKDKY